MPDGCGDLFGHVEPVGGEIDVVGDQGHPRAHDRRPGGRVCGGRTKIGRPLGFGDLVGQPLELATAHVFKIPARRGGGGLLVEIDRQLVACGHGCGHFTRQRHAIGHRSVLDRDKRHHVHRAHPGMFAFVIAQIDGGQGGVEQGQSSVTHLRRCAGKRKDGPVVYRVGLDVEQARAGGSNRPATRIEHVLAATFTDIGDAFD